jgi:putative serine/threonine protein kinase
MTNFIALDKVKNSRISKYLYWPSMDEGNLDSRLSELKKLGVKAIALGGPTQNGKDFILGKGNVGIVLKALYNDTEVALKIRRSDSDRNSMEQEAKYLELANTVKVGPKLFTWSQNFIVMEKLEGIYLRDLIQVKNPDINTVKRYIKEIIDKSRRLDQLGLDHGELVGVRKHYMIINEEPRIIDFESASTTRRTQNVTASVQSFFLSGSFSKDLKSLGLNVERQALLTALRSYKRDQSSENYQRILSVCKLV